MFPGGGMFYVGFACRVRALGNSVPPPPALPLGALVYI